MAVQPEVKVPGPAIPDCFDEPGPGRTSMSAENGLSRRTALVKLGVFLNGIVGIALAVPIVRYLLSPVIRERKIGYESWLFLGGLEQFPSCHTPPPPSHKPMFNS